MKLLNWKFLIFFAFFGMSLSRCHPVYAQTTQIITPDGKLITCIKDGDLITCF